MPREEAKMTDVTYLCPDCGQELEAKVLDGDKEEQKQVVVYICPEHGKRVIIEWDE